MKKAIIALICFCSLISIFIFGCRKKELDSIDEYATKPSHCYNGVRDFDETIIDAGGSCGSNNTPVESTCYLVQGDSVKIGIYKYDVDSCIKKINGNGEQVFTIYYGGGNIKLTFNANVYYGYELWVTSSSPEEDEFKCAISDSHYGSNNLTNGDGMLLTNGDDFAVQICEGYFWPPGFGGSEVLNIFAIVK